MGTSSGADSPSNLGNFTAKQGLVLTAQRYPPTRKDFDVLPGASSTRRARRAPVDAVRVTAVIERRPLAFRRDDCRTQHND
jgi:hypothetical protein